MTQGHDRQFYLCRALMRLNKTIMRRADRDALFTAACRSIVELGGFNLAWIGQPDTRNAGNAITTYYGTASAYLTQLKAASGDTLCHQAFRDDRGVVANDYWHSSRGKPWHHAARHAELRAAAAFPIRCMGRPTATLNVYADQTDCFDAQLVEQLDEIASNISFALDNLETDRLHRQAETDRDRLISVLETSPDLVCVVDPHGAVLYQNEQLSHRSGPAVSAPNGDAPGVRWTDELMRQPGFQWALHHGQWTGETTLSHNGGKAFPASIAIHAHRNEGGRVTHLSVTARDISEFRHAQEKIQRLTHYDTLTQLPNRALLRKRLNRDLARARRLNMYGAILHLDLDRFSAVNDTLGHAVADALLKQLAARLNGEKAERDTVARVCGDEFVVILNEIGDTAAKTMRRAQKFAERIIEAITRPYDVSGHRLYVTTSIGIALFRNGNDDENNLLKHANTAMHRAKASGRNAVRFFLPSMQEKEQRRFKLESELRLALEHNQLALYFQPQVDIDSGEIIGAEALLRWFHPQYGLTLPSHFISIAEDTGMILPIGKWVLTTAVWQLQQWLSSGLWSRRQTLAINVSPYQFRQGDFVQQVADVLTEASVPPSCIKLELTEGILVHDFTDAVNKMHALKHLGVGVAIDDFGTGYSSLAYLKRLPLDILKIDRSFVKEIPHDSNDAAIAETIISIAGHLGLQVIAEGVETETQLRFLRDKGCAIYQGFHFSKAVSAQMFAERMAWEARRHMPGSLNTRELAAKMVG